MTRAFIIITGLALILIGLAVVRRSGRPGGTRSAAQPSIQFEDITDSAGIRFRHCSGARGRKWMPETVGSGVAVLDYNNDGLPDILFVSSTDWPDAPNRTPHYPALYRNNGDGTFTDVTKAAGLAIDVFGMGAAVGDFDNDGFPDVYLTCIGPNHLFHNNRDGTFTDVTAKAGVAGIAVEPGGIQWKWSSSASWCDFDNDGVLDLFVCNYVKWTPKTDVYCGSKSGRKSYCPPTSYEGVPSTLYRGRGDGTFEDVSDKMGIGRHVGKSFGVVAADFNGDDGIDFAVTNDTSPNFLFLSDHGRGFREVGEEAGFAVMDTGAPKAGMGIDAADFLNNGRIGLVTGNFSKECLSLYENDGSAAFHDEAYPRGVAQPSLAFLTFGLFFCDFDLDGRQDIFAANGHIDDLVNENDNMITYEERPLLYHNVGGKFQESGLSAGRPFQNRIVARGCAWGDFFVRGSADIVVLSNNGRGYLWKNATAGARKWIGLKLHGTKSNRDGLGARIKVVAGGLTQTFQTFCGGSFLSTRQPWPLIGLNGADAADVVEIVWPSGVRTPIRNLKAGCYYEIVEGRPEPIPLTRKPVL